MELLQPLGLIALAGLPVIVALYILRQRRPPQVVGSLMLWRQAHVEVVRGRPWERFRPTLLMWLQLLAMTLIALALARPACVSQGSDGQRLVLLLDASASMGATDLAPSRWAVAVDRAIEAAQSAPEGSELAVLVAGRLTRVAEPFTRDRERVGATLRRLRDVGPDTVRGDLKEALLLAVQLGQDQSAREIVLFSDGAFDASRLPALGDLSLSYVHVGERAANLAITTFELRRAAGQRFGTSALCVVSNTGDVALSSHLQVAAQGRIIEARRLQLAPGESASVSAPIDLDEGSVRARLLDVTGDGDARDLLAADNEAFAVIAPERPARVRVVGDNPLVRRALEANPRLSLIGEAQGAASADVTVYVDTFPATPPSGRFLALGPPADNSLAPHDQTRAALKSPTIVAWDRGHPALLHTDMGQIRFAEVSPVTPNAAMVPIAEFQGDGGPALLAGQTPSWRGLIWTAPLMASDLPLRVAFPVFLYNAIGWLSPGGSTDPGHTVATGQALSIPAQPGDEVTLTDPRGQARTFTLRPDQSDGVFLMPQTEREGFYTAMVKPASPTQGALTRRFGVSLVDIEESSISPRASLKAQGGAITVATRPLKRVEERWASLLLVLLALVSLEWGLYLWRTRRETGGR